MRSLETITGTQNENPRIGQLRDFCKDQSIILYGAGLTGRTILQQLKKNGITPLWIADDTPSKQGTMLDGVEIRPLAAFSSVEKPFALVVTMMNPDMNFRHMRRQLNEKGIQHVFSFLELSFVFPGDLLPYFHFGTKEEILKDTKAIEQGMSLFTDEQSKDIFLRNLAFRLNLDFEVVPEADKENYFPADLFPQQGPCVFFDCGAYDGDTIKNFIGVHKDFDAVYAFEPDPVNFNKLLRYSAGLDAGTAQKVHVFNNGTGADHRYLRFNSLNNMASAISDDGDNIIQTLALDDLFLPALQNYAGAIFIKMDIEGAEPQALRGCRQLMAAKAPALAISSYHNPDDLWSLPLYIHSVNPAYRFYLRQHGNDSMDLVLYAIAEQQ